MNILIRDSVTELVPAPSFRFEAGSPSCICFPQLLHQKAQGVQPGPARIPHTRLPHLFSRLKKLGLSRNSLSGSRYAFNESLLKGCFGCPWQGAGSRAAAGWPLWDEARGWPMLDTAGSSWFQPAPQWTPHRRDQSAKLVAPLKMSNKGQNAAQAVRCEGEKNEKQPCEHQGQGRRRERRHPR